MKKITELYEEILQDDGLKAEFVEAAKDNQMEAFLLKNDCNATLSQLQEFAEKKQRELVSLPDAELDAAAGGASWREAGVSIFALGAGCLLLAAYSNQYGEMGPREGSDRLLCRL